MSAADRSLTLADAALPRAGAAMNVLLVLLAAALTAVAAQFEIRLPWTPVPLTGQTMVVLLCGAVLGARRAFLAQALYLIAGTCGAPVFSGGAAGPIHLVGPSGGYLVAFPFAALVTGLLAERAWDRKPVTMFLAMLAGSAVIFAVGLVQLSRFVPQGSLLATGLLPFVLGDVLKSALAAGLFPLAWGAVKRSENA